MDVNEEDSSAQLLCFQEQYPGSQGYEFSVSIDATHIPSPGTLFKHICRPLRPLRRVRLEGVFLFGWLVHICIIWTLRAMEASATTKG